VPLLPWFVLGAGGGLFTAHFERVLIGAQGADFALGFADRLVLAGRVFWFYLGKLVWPADLIFVYPRWSIDASVWWQWLFPAAGLGLLAGLAWWSRRARGPLAAALLFGGSLFPVLGFVNVFPFVFSYVADHFQYLASLAVFALAGAGLSLLPRSAGRITATLLAGLFGVLTWNQAPDYRDNVTLYEATLRRNPGAWLAHHNLATLLVDGGRPDDALPHIERTLALRPDYPEALNNLGNCLTQLKRPGEALAPLERAIQLQPRYAAAHNNLGAALMALGRAEEGRARFETAVRLQPDYATARRNLGQALASAGRIPEATEHFTRAVQLNPADGAAQLQLGTALAVQARYAEALPHFAAALELDPESADAHLRLAMTLRSLGRTAEATEHYQEAIRLNPALAR
jgi:tetratricopeptide (TPR) repeat protein